MVKHQWYTTPLANAVREIMNQHDYLFVIPGRNIAHIARKDDGKISSACGVSNTYKFSEVYVIDTPNRVCEQCVIRRLCKGKDLHLIFNGNPIARKAWREFLSYLKSK